VRANRTRRRSCPLLRVLDTFYGRLKKCGDLACNGQPFTEHHNVADLRPSGDGGGLDWEQVAGKLRAAIKLGSLPAGSDPPSVRDLQERQGIPRTTLQWAFRELSNEGLIVVRQGRTAVVAGGPPEGSEPGVRRWRPGAGHDYCKLAGCKRHVCSPMKPGTIRQIHSILSGAFDAAKRWKWVDDNPAELSKPPTVTTVKRPATSPAEVAKVIAFARSPGTAGSLHHRAAASVSVTPAGTSRLPPTWSSKTIGSV
jgi:hypothetical protein